MQRGQNTQKVFVNIFYIACLHLENFGVLSPFLHVTQQLSKLCPIPWCGSLALCCEDPDVFPVTPETVSFSSSLSFHLNSVAYLPPFACITQKFQNTVTFSSRSEIPRDEIQERESRLMVGHLLPKAWALMTQRARAAVEEKGGKLQGPGDGGKDKILFLKLDAKMLRIWLLFHTEMGPSWVTPGWWSWLSK